MNIEQMEYIIEVAKCGSLTKAAENCHITVTGVSRAISLFEQEIGIRIFTRSRAGTIVTPEGQSIIAKANRILQQIEELKSEAQSYREMNNAKLRISTIPGPISLLIDVITELKKEFPNSRIEIKENSTDAVIDDVKNERSDIGFFLLKENHLPATPDLIFEPLMKDNMVLGVSVHCPLANQTSVTLQDLQNYPFVLYNDPYIIAFVNTLDKPDILFQSNNVEAILKAVKEDIAVTIGTDYSFRGYTMSQNRGIVTIPFEISVEEPSYLWSVTSRNNTVSEAEHLFVKRVKNLLLV
ncbi:LysR family transcriptional regulator [Paenibacillus nicotianae]|uniref:LysR family transcriptional regulator n=1 Tax=Paenibacillus nicotianae TaxID=1526551 RepID=A0ABW4UVS1_9BACL